MFFSALCWIRYIFLNTDEIYERISRLERLSPANNIIHREHVAIPMVELTHSSLIQPERQEHSRFFSMR